MSLRTSPRSVMLSSFAARAQRAARLALPRCLRSSSGSDGLPDPLVALLVELHRELLGTGRDDAAALHDVHLVGHDVVEQALVVGDDEGTEVGAAGGVDALRDDLQRVDVEAGVGLVEDRVARLEHQQLEDLRALLLTAREALVQVALEDRLVPVEVLHGALELAVELHDADLVTLFAAGVESQAQE